jgi:non-ribosomal peptide synthetase component F
MQYREWALWQRQQVESGAWDAQRRFWSEQLAGLDATEPDDFAGAWLRRPMPGSGAPFAVLLERWAQVLFDWLGRDEVAIAVPVANRRRTAVENTVGMFVNTLALRCRRGEPLKPLLDAAFANQDFPFEALGVALPRYLFVVHPAPSSQTVEMDTARSEYDLRLSIAGQNANLQFRTGAVSAAAASELLDRFLTLPAQ